MCSALIPPQATGLSVPVKCGQCMECRLAYSREWAIRMSHEAQGHAASSMLNLTYDDAHLPEYGQLVKRDLQLFFKRLRLEIGPFRYVACGEYGERYRRPHFHVALFGCDFSADRVFYGNSPGSGLPLFQSAALSRAWFNGLALVGSFTFESAGYIARYITKRISGPNASPLPLAADPVTGELIMPNPEFLLMSRRPGIGSAWFEKHFKTDVFPHGRVITSQGTPAPVPGFYKRKLNHMDAERMRELTYLNRESNLSNVVLEDKPERRAARSKYAKARTGVFQRDF